MIFFTTLKGYKNIYDDHLLWLYYVKTLFSDQKTKVLVRMPSVNT